MSNYYNKKEDGLDFKQLILGHFKKIMEISLNEFTQGYWNISKTPTSETKTYIPDSREEFLQGIEILTSVLYPFFDEKMKEVYTKYVDEDKRLTEKHSKGGYIQKNNTLHAVEKHRLVKDLFREISCLLHRLDYFKVPIYSEEDFEDEEGVDYDLEK